MTINNNFRPGDLLILKASLLKTATVSPIGFLLEKGYNLAEPHLPKELSEAVSYTKSLPDALLSSLLADTAKQEEAKPSSKEEKKENPEEKKEEKKDQSEATTSKEKTSGHNIDSEEGLTLAMADLADKARQNKRNFFTKKHTRDRFNDFYTDEEFLSWSHPFMIVPPTFTP